MKPNFGCIYKTGGDYSADDVLRLKRNIERHTTVEFNFICFTDDPILLPSTVTGVTDEYEGHWAKPLINNWPGWWSVPELFRIEGPTMVTGLDTIFVDSVDPFFELASNCTPEQFFMIHAFKKGVQWASGFMVWNGDWSWLYKEFIYGQDSVRFRGEQEYTVNALIEKEVKIQGTQDVISGIYSYKHHCRREGKPPEDARAILFHGRPRPSQVKTKWVRRELR